jgi:undecaprenyl diphosphate synthase
MDGNGRWAHEHGLARSEGHRRGAEMIEKIVTACHDRNVGFLTLYAFSEENWSRPSDEVMALMQLLRHFLASKRAEMIRKSIRFMTIGDTVKLPADVQKELAETMEATCAGKKMTLTVALSYGSRQEILHAVNALLSKGAGHATCEQLEKELYTRDLPDPDLLIRTSGECRISNFLLWQLAYTELYFTETLWPEFDEKELDRAIESYAQRERRFGMTSEQVKG